MANFTADGIAKGSFQKTLRSIMEMADPGVFVGMSPEQIAEVLITELRWIAPYNEQELQAAEEYLRRRGQEGQEIIAHIVRQLQQLDPEKLYRVADKVAALTGEKASAVDSEVLAVATAVCMVDHPDVTAIIGGLVSVMADLDQAQKTKISNIVTYLLPFKYAPGVIHELTEQVKKGHLGLVEDTVSTRTLAEVIMAGYDGTPVKYARLSDKGELLGKTAIDYQEEPEGGPGDPQSPKIAVLRAARDLLLDLVALKDATFNASAQAQRPEANGNDEAIVLHDLETYATQLRGAFKGLRTIHGGRTIYCVLQLPKGKYQREFRKEVLREVAGRVPQLLFVELAPNPAGLEREAEVQEYIKHVQMQAIPL